MASVGRPPSISRAGAGRLDHHFLAGPAGVLGPAHHQHPELGRDDVQPLGDVLADPVQSAGAAGAGLVLDVDDCLDPRQMRRQRSAVASRRLAARGRPALGSVASVLLGLGGLDLLDVLQAQLQLIDRQRLGAAAEAVALQLLDDLAQALGLCGPLGDRHRLQRRRDHPAARRPSAVMAAD